jgi:hypothetical protein
MTLVMTFTSALSGDGLCTARHRVCAKWSNGASPVGPLVRARFGHSGMVGQNSGAQVRPYGSSEPSHLPIPVHSGGVQPKSTQLRISRTRVKTASSMGSVSLPVNVFCWLG